MTNGSNASESVFHGRVGTGEAQILGGAVNPIHVFQRQKQQELLDNARRRQLAFQRRKERDKRIDELRKYKFDKPWDLYQDSIKENVIQYRQEMNEALSQDRVSPNLAFDSPYFSQLRNKIIQDTAKSKTAEATHKMQIEAIEGNKDWDHEWGKSRLNDYLVGDTVDDIDLDSAQNLGAHPRIVDTRKSIENVVEGIKDQVKGSTIGEIQESGLGKYMVVSDNKARFGFYDEDGNPVIGVTEDLIDHVLDSNPRISDRIRWDIAENSVANMSEGDISDEDEVFRVYESLKDSPVYAEEVREKVRRILEKLQRVDSRDRIQRLGNYPSRSGSRSFRDFEVVESTAESLKDYNEIGKDDLVGVQGIAMETPNLARSIEFQPNKLSTVQGFVVGEDGSPVIKITTKETGDVNAEVTSETVPMTKNNLTKVRNSIKDSRLRSEFDDMVKRFNDRAQEASRFTLDRDKLNSVYSSIRAEWSKMVDSSSREREVAANIQDILTSLGIEAEVDTDSSLLPSYVPWTSDDLIINGEKYDLSKDADIERLKSFLFNNSKDQFIKAANSSTGGAY